MRRLGSPHVRLIRSVTKRLSHERKELHQANRVAKKVMSGTKAPELSTKSHRRKRDDHRILLIAGGIIIEEHFSERPILRMALNAVGTKFDLQIPTTKHTTAPYAKLI